MSASDVMVTSKTVDLTNCDQEQIQYAGAIQPHGALLVIQEPELRVLQASRNTANLLGVGAEELAGGVLQSLLTEQQIFQLRACLEREKLEGAPVHVGRWQFDGGDFDVLVHRHDQVVILELEQRPENAGRSVLELYADLQNAISKLEATASLQPFLDIAAQQIRFLTGFDRVMIYKFMEDDSGWVRSEALTEGMDSYLGLHYPPSDIPAPARRLFSLTWVRHQPDISYTPVPIFPETNPLTGGPLDMSYALLRSVSIMYVDYLKNMGTSASLVMTLLKNAKLWGLVACHHHTGPRHVPYEVRVACELLAHMISLLISAKEELENHEYRMKLKSTQMKMVEKISLRGDFVSGFIQDSPNLLDFVNADDAATAINGQIVSVGRTPSEDEMEEIVHWLSSATPQHVFATDCLSALLPQAEGFKDRCAGTFGPTLLSSEGRLYSLVSTGGSPDRQLGG
jgi:chemotaxis family two-component system sensor kinase Cph1